MKLDSIEIKMIDFIKTNNVTKPLYRKLKSNANKKKFNINSINKAKPHKKEGEQIRYNLIIPTMRATRVFAGISSAIKFLLSLAGEEAECRIIVISNELYSDKDTYKIKGFSHDRKAPRSIWFMSDGRDLSVRKNDVFIYTSWKTAVSFEPILKWQRKAYNMPERKVIYLIQDYEPGFFAWSTEYILAEATYKSDDQMIAVFNSNELYTFFKNHGYSFAYENYFAPSLNTELKKYALAAENKKKREKRILIYGRPSEQRNAFEIIRYSLQQWSEKYDKASEWKILSLGEGFEDIQLKNNVIESRGKVSLEEYASYMLSSYAGISLMVSPHPSYPPLEMSTFGVKTITNTYENKDLSSFNSNIISLDTPSPDNIVKCLSKLCDKYNETESYLELNDDYLKEDSLMNVTDDVRKYVLGMINDNKNV